MDVISEYLQKGGTLIIADLLSLITISTCVYIKVPQIQTIRANRSSQGISVMSLGLELFSYTTMCSYNYTRSYEFLSYMEYPILLIQEYVLIYFVLKYQNYLGLKTKFVSILYVVLISLVYFKVFACTITILSFLVPFCTPIGATSKVLQLLAILRSQDASSVSRTTWALSAFTNLTRIYTICVQSFDMMLLFNFLVSTLLSASVFVAACVYKKSKLE